MTVFINSRAAFVHMAGDALSSLAVVVAGIIVHYTHWVYADSAVSVLIALFICYSAVGIVRDAANILMECTPEGLDVEKLVAGIKAISPVRDVHDLHVWTVGDGMNMLSCHVTLPASCSLERCSSIVDDINDKLHNDFSIGHATIQTEIEGMCRGERSENLHCDMEPHQHGDNH